MAKAGRPRKNSTGLPAWFDIDKYAGVKEFTSLEWLRQLVYRKRISDEFAFWTSSTQEAQKRGRKDGVEGHHRRQLKRFVLQPLHLLTANPTATLPMLEHGSSNLLDENEKHRIPMRNEALTETYGDPRDWGLGVRDVLNGETVLLYNRTPLKIRRYLEDAETVILVNSMGVHTHSPTATDAKWLEVTQYLHSPCSIEDGAAVTVDLTLPDEVLYREFQAYVREKRKLLGEVAIPFYGARDFGGWYKCGVLPYIDLKLWELTQGMSFHWPTFAEHLKRHTGLRYGSEDALAKAAKACMKLLLDRQTLHILRTQAAREQVAQTPKLRKLILKKAEK